MGILVSGEGRVMRISKTGGLIAAGSRQAAEPMLQVGSIPIIKRIVLTFQQVGIFPIVVVTGADEDDVRAQLSNYGMIFLPNSRPEHPQLLESVKIGLAYLRDKCEQVAFTPVNAPMFTPDTLAQLLSAGGEVVTPSFHGRSGHPVVIAQSAVDAILAYDGGDGLRGALLAMGPRRRWLEVEDEGVLASVHDLRQLEHCLAGHNHALLHPMLHMRLERESAFFDARLKLLLFLIGDTCNVRRACDAMALSRAKAWSLINRLEQELGFPVVERRRGGARGGTRLTERGARFLQTYQIFEERVFRYAQSQFHELFLCTK